MQRHERIAWDLRKVQDAQQTEMDYGVGNVTQALAEHGLYERSLVIFHTDNVNRTIIAGSLGLHSSESASNDRADRAALPPTAATGHIAGSSSASGKGE